MTTFDKYLSDKVKFQDNVQGQKSVIVSKPIKKRDTIISFPIDNIITSDMVIFERLKKILLETVQDTDILQFCLALNILYHPKKYQFVHKFILQNYSPFKPFLFPPEQMNQLQDTISYYLVKRAQHIYDTIMLAYRQLDDEITHNIEFRLKVIYGFCQSRSHGLRINETNVRCITPASIINNTKFDNVPYLEHRVDGDNWIISAVDDYNVGDEVLDCHNNPNPISHPYYHSLVLHDWKPIMSIFSGIHLNEPIKTSSNSCKFELKEGVNQKKMLTLSNIYDDVSERIKKLDCNDPYQNVVHFLLQREINHFITFQKSLQENDDEIDEIIN